MNQEVQIYSVFRGYHEVNPQKHLRFEALLRPGPKGFRGHNEHSLDGGRNHELAIVSRHYRKTSQGRWVPDSTPSPYPQISLVAHNRELLLMAASCLQQKFLSEKES